MPQLNIKRKKKDGKTQKRLTALTYNAAISNIINNGTLGLVFFLHFFIFVCV